MRRRHENFPDNGFEAWGGYMQAKMAKLEEQFSSRAVQEEIKLSNIFNGISIFVNGYTNPTADELKSLMSKHGGVYHTYQRREDYIIASNLPDTKVKTMCLAKVVRPEWVTESISACKLLDYRDFLLFKNHRNQPQLNFDILKKDSLVIKKDLQETTVPEISSESTIYEQTLPHMQTHNIENKKSLSYCAQKSEVVKTAVDPNFITEFYNNSRLHHISQLGAFFKQHVNDLRENSSFEFPARKNLIEKIKTISSPNIFSQLCFEGGKTIMHIDMDCFFVSVGLRKRPDLRGKPVAVTHSKGGQAREKRSGVDRNAEFNLYKQKQAKKITAATGVSVDHTQIETRVNNIANEGEKYGSLSEIASCSYEARAKGVCNGMFMGSALRLCPELQTIAYDFDGYKEVAYTLYNTVAQYTLDIEAVSCDEMYVDCTELLNDMSVTVQDFATALRDQIKTKTGCPCSTGFGGNRLQARLATKKAKPDGQFFLSVELVDDFMFDIKLQDLPGVGRQTSLKLESLGHKTCGTLQNVSLSYLQQHLGNKTGSQLYDQCRGKDNHPLNFFTIRKSVSAEVNYGIRFENNDQCIEFLKQLSNEVCSRMNQFKVVGKCITLKLMVRAEEAPVETAKFMGHGFCNVINKSSTLSNSTNDLEIITREVLSLCKKQNIDPKEMRGIGIQISKLESTADLRPTKGSISHFFTNIKTEDKFVNKRDDSKGNLHTEVPSTTKLKQTPKKNKTNAQSPTKKSPILGITKSPFKRRGRPPKNTSLKMPTYSSKGMLNKFLLQSTENTKELTLNVDKNVDESKPPARPVVEEKRQGLLSLPWEKVRELLRAWLDSNQTPAVCDISMFSVYMREMVVNKTIDKVNILLNFLRRRTQEINRNEWTDVYEHVLETVQNAMIAVYGKKLYITH